VRSETRRAGAGKHVALYFSKQTCPESPDHDQLKTLRDYQREWQKDTLCATFRTGEELRRLITEHLPKIVSGVYSRSSETSSNVFL
jgi:hypothetical protein